MIHPVGFVVYQKIADASVAILDCHLISPESRVMSACRDVLGAFSKVNLEDSVAIFGFEVFRSGDGALLKMKKNDCKT